MTRINIPVCICAILLFISSNLNPSIGAEITISEDTWGNPILDIMGKIQNGDLDKIKDKSATIILKLDAHNNTSFTFKPLQFHLNTDGGDILEAIKIGHFARYILAEINSYGKIIVAPGSKWAELLKESPREKRDIVVLQPGKELTENHIVRNYGAGVLIFYGAVKRHHRDNYDQRLGIDKKKRIPVIGLHRPYYDKKYFSTLSSSQASNAYKQLETTVRNYLKEMGAPQTIIDRMFNRASNKIDLLTADYFRQYYKAEESFLEEWLIARCGGIGYRNFFKGKELEDFIRISKERAEAYVADKTPISERKFDKTYPSKYYSNEYVEYLYKKLNIYHWKNGKCRNSAILNHQREWAKNYKSQ